MINFRKLALISSSVIIFTALLGTDVLAQDRPRVVVGTSSSRPTNQPQPANREQVTRSTSSRPTNPPVLTNKIVVVGNQPVSTTNPKVTKNSSIRATNGVTIASSNMLYNQNTSSMIMAGIQSRLGIPYLYGSTGPNRYDCSGFVWSVFNDAGINFTRTSARVLWNSTIPVEGDERYKFGTLVFMNGLGHMGIVLDENGFYHASSSKGITYSPFKGYWEKRINGFRRMPAPGEMSDVER